MVLSDKDLRQRIIQEVQETKQAIEWWEKGDWEKIGNKIIIDPFQDLSLGPCCYGLSVGDEYVSLRDPYNPKQLKKGQHISIGPSETVLILTREYICLPKNILGMIVPKATWIFEGISLSASRIDPTWYGKLLIGITNLAKNPVALDYGEEFCTCYFMESTQVTKVLSRETHKSLGRDTIGTIRFEHAKPQKLILPDKVSKEDIEKVVDLYGWPWDVVRGMFELTKRDIGAYIEKEVTSDIVDEATSAAIKIAFDRLETQYREQTRWTRNLTITLITVVSTVGAAIVGGIVTYIIKQLT
jgi:deoxycytidine triphosphate deaminase